jgi:hypothetical protein
MTTKRLLVTMLVSIVALVIVAAVGVGVYVNHFSPSAPLLAGTRAIAIVRALERNIENKAEYVPPADGLVSARQIERFVKVEEEVETAIAEGARTIDAVSLEMTRLDARPERLTVAAALRSIGAADSVLRRAKQAQVKALNAAAFSKDEFEWVRHRVYSAAGIELVQLAIDDLSHFETPDQFARIVHRGLGAVPDRDRQQVDPHRAGLQRWRGLAFFGL